MRSREASKEAEVNLYSRPHLFATFCKLSPERLPTITRKSLFAHYCIPLHTHIMRSEVRLPCLLRESCVGVVMVEGQLFLNWRSGKRSVVVEQA
jgi:hypothetical protein